MVNRHTIEILTGTAQATSYQDGPTQAVCKTPAGVLYQALFNTGDDVILYKSTDNGATWAAIATVRSGVCEAVSFWYDEWSGVAGGLIHMAYVDSTADDIFYRNFDVDTETLGTETTVLAGTSYAAANNCLSICRSRGGNLMVVYDIDGGTEDGAAKSTDVGATWAPCATPTEDAVDMWLLLPGHAADNQDFMLIFWDVSADELSRKLYDDSGDSWAETSISGSMIEGAQSAAFPHFAAVVDLTNSKNIIYAWNAVDAANQDLVGWSVTESAITALGTAVLNATDDCGLCALYYDEDADRWYIFWAGNPSGTETFPGTTHVYYRYSDDACATWSTENVRWSEGTGYTRLDSPMIGDGFPCITAFGPAANGNGNRHMTTIPNRTTTARQQIIGA